MNKRLILVKVMLVLAVFIGLVGPARVATVQSQAQTGGPGTTAVAYMVIPPGPQPQVNWNA